MIFLAKVGIAMAGVAVVGGAALSSQGFVHVKVHERQPAGTNVNVIVPAALLSTTLRFVPNHYLADAAEDLRPYLHIVDTAVPTLEDCPDGILVEVRDISDHVVVAKKSGSLVVDVMDPDDTVHVSAPLRAVQESLHAIAEAGGAKP
jgi:hypothetical protein